jgi:TonB-dependent starch-binding outer membrane protein SusC
MRVRSNTGIISLRLLLFAIVTVNASNLIAQSDTTKSANDSVKVETTNGVKVASLSQDFKGSLNNVPLQYVSSQPYVSLQQIIKGNLAGVYVQEPNGEPGTEQNIFVRGISSPLLSKRELFDQQATVFLNGIPLAQDNPFAYEIQKYDFNRIGPATNLLATINPNNIKSIEVIKDPIALASLGPIAANGAIWITTKNAIAGQKEISINSYYGIVGSGNVTPINAAYENNFRTPSYDKYGTVNDRLNYSPYLRDSTNADYYGPANWTDLYFKNAPVYSADLSLTGGSERANFRFFGSATKNAGNADNTSISRYTGSFFINVAPIEWLTVSSMINYNKLDRTRNRNIRDRLAEQRYIPDLTNPLTPNKSLYGAYLNEFSKSIDDNTTNSIQGYVAVSANVKNFIYKGRIAFDYNEGIRDAFWPTTLLEGNNFVSNYFGYNQRFLFSNSLGYNFKLGNRQSLLLEAGQNFMADVNKYDYAYAYNGPNDFIKINVVNGDPNATNYLLPTGFRVYYFPGKMQSNLISFSGNATYSYNDVLKLTGLVRRDGTSTMQRDNRWFTSFSGGAEWSLKNQFLSSNSSIGSLSLNASWARIGKLLKDDRFAAGPQYRVDLGWGNEPGIGSYTGIPGISRPYTSGWVGYGIPWSYSDQLSIGVRYGSRNGRIKVALDVYNKDDKQMLFPVPVASEWGYTGAYKTGLAVNNTGADLSVGADILTAHTSAVNWAFTANLNYNKNKLKALPGGLTELIVGSNKLEVGKPVDAFWLLKNEGIYNSDADVPKNPQTNQPLTYKGVALKAGDPRWADVNGDFIINDKDKQLSGNYMPKVSGGFGSSVGYKAFSLDFQFYFALGKKALNQYAASHLDFINTEVNNDINSVKEITFWQKKMDFNTYPVYNPWSSVVPYRVEQDLFLDDASFLKMRTLSLSYDFSKRGSNKNIFKKLKRSMIYVTGTNLFTLSRFKADDPELVNYNGIYTGYGLPIPTSIIIGFKVDL